MDIERLKKLAPADSVAAISLLREAIRRSDDELGFQCLCWLNNSEKSNLNIDVPLEQVRAMFLGQ